MKSGNLNFLETSGPLQARNGTALPFNNNNNNNNNNTINNDPKTQFMMTPLHVSALEFHLQGVYELKVSQVQHSSSSIIRPNCRLLNIKLLKFLNT
jgi:hypothetical protein